MIDPQVREIPVELQLPTREIGPREEPERYLTTFIVNDGFMSPEEHEEELRKAAQACNQYAWNREAREEAEGTIKSSSEAWQNGRQKSKVEASKTIHRFLMVHLQRELHPSEAHMSQPVLKKVLPATGRARPATFYSGDEPPRIGSAPVQPPPPPKPTSTWDVQPQGVFHLPAATPHDSMPSKASSRSG